MMQIGTYINIFLGLSGIFVMLFLLVGTVVIIILARILSCLKKSRVE
jgi:hypothetical protein